MRTTPVTVRTRRPRVYAETVTQLLFRSTYFLTVKYLLLSRFAEPVLLWISFY